MALTLGTTLSYYKRKDIQEEMVKQAKDKEIAFRFDDYFGKRPDVLTYPGDVLEVAKNKMTSVHCSEELWNNPLQISTGLKKEQLDELRKGWDLVIDIDCPSWELSKIVSWLIIRSLQEHAVKSISVKFSGNKGFHIAVPFEAFPQKIAGTYLRNGFPEIPSKIALYLLDYIGEKHISVNSSSVIFGAQFSIDFQTLSELTGKEIKKLTYEICKTCGAQPKKIMVPNLNQSTIESLTKDELESLRKAGKYYFSEENKCLCEKNSSQKIVTLFRTEEILNLDTILLSSRHLYRMVYSLHEKSGLVSVPFDPNTILQFEKSQAEPTNIIIYPFLDRTVLYSDAENLLKSALEYKQGTKTSSMIDYERIESQKKEFVFKQEFEMPEKAIGEEAFPPCIKLILNGLEDGRKRSCFALINFLASCGWEYDQIEARLLEWNEKNPNEGLRPQYIIGQVRYAKQQNKKAMPPPSCNNPNYYKGLQVCKPDQLCAKIKNPLQYAKLKQRMLDSQVNASVKTVRKKKEEDFE